MGRQRNYIAAVALGALAIVIGAVGANAQNLTFRLKGGGFTVNGELVGFDGTKYLIRSPVLGQMSLEATRFDCVGAGCPSAPISTGSLAPTFRPTGGTQKIAIAGSNTIGTRLMPALIEGFAQHNGLTATKEVGSDPLQSTFNLSDAQGRVVATIDLERRGSSTAFPALRTRSIQIGMADRPIAQAEVAQLAAAGLGNMRAATSEHVIGIDGLIVIVSSENTAVSIPLKTIADIFSGRIRDWSDIGLPPGRINVYAPDDKSGSYSMFKKFVLGPFGAQLDPTATRVIDNGDQADQVARDPNGIGVVGVAYQRNAKAINIERSCGLIARPTEFSIKTEEYPLSRRLHLYTAGRPKQALANNLLRYAMSPAAQPVISSVDFVDQKPSLVPFGEQGARVAYALNAPNEDFNMGLMRQFITEVTPASRVTITFRFAFASTELDPKAQQDITRLIRMVQEPAMSNRQVLLIGFADSAGGFAGNLTLSDARAKAVQQAILSAPGGGALARRMRTLAFSELAPVACNDNDLGRQFNRRVEVWVR